MYCLLKYMLYVCGKKNTNNMKKNLKDLGLAFIFMAIASVAIALTLEIF